MIDINLIDEAYKKVFIKTSISTEEQELRNKRCDEHNRWVVSQLSTKCIQDALSHPKSECSLSYHMLLDELASRK